MIHPHPHIHLYAIGNALVDTEHHVSDEQLQALGIEKGRMTLIDAERRTELLRLLDGQPGHHPHQRVGGGSAGNTVVALAQLGGHGFYSCKVADDDLGDFYQRDLEHHGVATNLNHTRPEPGQSGHCMVFVTPDAERSMCTFLGATATLDASALHPRDIAKSRVYYMEGYLSASPSGLDAALQGRAAAKAEGVALATTLSDVSMITFCRPGLEAMIGDGVDYLFCNEEEAQAWTGLTDTAAVVDALSKLAGTVCMTRGPQGCIVIRGDRRDAVPAPQVRALDTVGAGDMFAGAFLYAVTHGHDAVPAARLATAAASTVVAQAGARLRTEQLHALRSAWLRETATA
ncbi:adenosine kinase [Hydrogenophaga aquatica]